MFSYIKGSLEEQNTDSVVVENNGIGYFLFVPISQMKLMPQIGSEVKLYTYMQVKEDGIVLFGFADTDSLDIFKQLLGVSGVGPKGALGILSVLTPNELRTAILTQDAKSISKAPGIGAKTAQRIIIDLKDKVSIDDIALAEDDMPATDVTGDITAAKHEAIEALVALGYSSKEAKEALSKVETDNSFAVEDYLKMALKFMG